ncbi:MAG TPA: alkene reductase [Methyloversatilis sp.]
MSHSALFTPARLGRIEIANRIVMAPLTRSRADDSTDVPSPFAAEYYGQRASAGLIVTEATQVSRMAKGYVGTPAIYDDTQVRAWTAVADAVHKAGGRIVMQLWHVGRSSHADLLPGGAAPVAPSAIRADSISFTANGPKPCDMPVALDQAGIRETVAAFANAARNARTAGFDGVEIHAANGYLIDQFLRDRSNQRNDEYGGSARNRVRFALEVAQAMADVWDAGNIGIRLSPFGTYGDMGDSDPENTFGTLIEQLNPLGLAYLHMVEEFPFANINMDSGTPADREQLAVFERFRTLWQGAYIANGALTADKAADYVARGRATAASFGRPFIANPDFAERLQNGWPLAGSDNSVYYGGGAKGYTDFPRHSNVREAECCAG